MNGREDKKEVRLAVRGTLKKNYPLFLLLLQILPFCIIYGFSLLDYPIPLLTSFPSAEPCNTIDAC